MDKKITYSSTGRGRPLLLLHGWNGSIADFSGVFKSTLAARYRLIALDLPGFGASEYFSPSFPILNSLIAALMIELGIRKINILGFCMGAIIGLDFAINNPEKVDRLMLYDTYISFPFVLRFLLNDAINMPILGFFLKHPAGMAVIKRLLFIKNVNYSSGIFKRFSATVIGPSIAYIKMLYAYSGTDHYARMAESCPETHVICGEHTDGTVKATALRIHRSIKKSRLLQLSCAGHFPIEENPAGLAELVTGTLK